MTETLYDNLSRDDLDAIAARIATDRAPASADALALLAEVRRLRLALALERRHRSQILDALRCLTGAPDDLDPDAPIAYEITWRGLTQLRRRDGARS
jgi:hypothetical protein